MYGYPDYTTGTDDPSKVPFALAHVGEDESFATEDDCSNALLTHGLKHVPYGVKLAKDG